MKPTLTRSDIARGRACIEQDLAALRDVQIAMTPAELHQLNFVLDEMEKSCRPMLRMLCAAAVVGLTIALENTVDVLMDKIDPQKGNDQ